MHDASNNSHALRWVGVAMSRPSTRPRSWAVLLGSVLALLSASQARPDTIESALVRAYQYNPVLNAERARQRGTDENVSTALSGYRPQVAANFSPELDRRARPVPRRNTAIRDPASDIRRRSRSIS